MIVTQMEKVSLGEQNCEGVVHCQGLAILLKEKGIEMERME